MKIVFINQVLTRCAIESLAQKAQVLALVAKNAPLLSTVIDNVTYVVLSRTTFGLQPVKRFFLPKNQSGIPQYALRLASLLKKEKPNLIVATEIFQLSTWQCMQYARKKRVRLFILSETKAWPRSRLALWFLKISLWNVRRNLTHIEKIIVWTEQGKSWYKQHLPEVDVALIPAAVDTDFFKPIQGHVWLQNDTLRILMNARFVDFKRHIDLFYAVNELCRKGKKVSVSLIGSDDLGKNDVERLIERLGIENIVTILPSRAYSEMPALYHAHDVLVLPSYNEAVGMVVLEAMACGIPTITSDTVGANVYVKNRESGLIFETGNIFDLTEKLEQCFDKQMLLEKGNMARQESLKYSQMAISGMWHDLLNDSK
jgi:glycosyltransferase involved in cell wall biosynthesis